MEDKIARQLKDAISETGFPLLEIARQAKIDQGQLSRFMRGERTMTLPAVEKLCALLGLELHRVKVNSRSNLLKPKRGRSKVDTTKYDVEISKRLIKSCTFKNHALFAVVRFLCNDRNPPVSPEELQRRCGFSAAEKRLFFAVDGKMNSAEFVKHLTERESNWWHKDKELIHFGGKTYAFNREWGESFHTVRENLMKRFPEVRITPCP